MLEKDAAVTFERERKRMVDFQLRGRGICSRRVLDAMSAVERHRFVPGNVIDQAYGDCPLPIGRGQTISQPYIVAYMTEALELSGGERVLEIGCGSGFQAAVLSYLGCSVLSVERVPALAKRARRVLDESGFGDVRVEVGDGSLGWPDEAPYERIIVTASGPQFPEALLGQLSDGGIGLMPVGVRWNQDLVRVRRRGGELVSENLLGCIFVPLLGAQGWKEP